MKYLLILGNGFSIDLISHLRQAEEIPLANLFSYGDRLTWPGSKKHSFLSFRNTPNLWILGVRPSNPPEKNNHVIENIITCANSFYLKDPRKRSFGSNTKKDIYINAYKELSIYLKYLFVKLDEQTNIDKYSIEKWPWGIFFNKLNQDTSVSSVDIITFNYDLWLERALNALSIEFNIESIGGQDEKKFSISKPHGSISFSYKTKLDPDAFAINYESEIVEGAANDFTISMENLGEHSPTIPLIPPAGDSARFNATWAGEIRSEAEQKADGITSEDKVIICGLSYWHVDRTELDGILLKLPESVELSLINPHPPATFDAVLASLFDNYEHALNMKNYLEVRS